MTRSNKIRLVAPVAFVCLLQVLVPLVMMVALLVVKSEQRAYTEYNAGNVKLFTTIRIDRQSEEAKSIGSGELMYNGLLYDIRSMTVDGQEYVIVALPDEKETDIYRHLGVIDNPAEGLTSADLHPLPFYFLYYESQDVWPVQYVRYSPHVFRLAQTPPANNIVMKIPKPPPRLSFAV